MAALEAGMKVYEEDDAQRNSFLENPSQINGDQIQSFRSDPSSQLPGTGGSHSAQVHVSSATDGVGTGTSPLVGSSMARIQRAPEGEGTPAPNLSNSVTFLEPNGRISHPGRDSSAVAPPLSFSSPAVNQPGSGGPPSSVLPQAESKSVPAAAAAGIRRSPSSVGSPYVFKLGSQ